MANLGFRAVGRFCAVDLSDLSLALPPKDELLRALKRLGFRQLEADPVAWVRSRVGESEYRRGALPREAPKSVDCSSLVKWAYGKCGIYLPRYTIDQRSCGALTDFRARRAGDLIFFSGRISHYDRDSTDGVGHVGMVTEQGTMIHAANSRRGVVEDPLDES
ncbi:MAG: NlpC/P60 family protein, partial [Candidatus Liptonbacteria bacterium]